MHSRNNNILQAKQWARMIRVWDFRFVEMEFYDNCSNSRAYWMWMSGQTHEFIIHGMQQPRRRANNLTKGPLHDPVTWCRIDYAGVQVTEWDFPKQRNSYQSSPTFFVLKVPLCNLQARLMINSLPYDWIAQRAYLVLPKKRKWRHFFMHLSRYWQWITFTIVKVVCEFSN